MVTIDYETEQELFDNQYYAEAYSKYEQKRNKDLETCGHCKWSKSCAICKRIISSELTDQTIIDIHRLEREKKQLEERYDYLLSKYVIELYYKR